MSEGCCAARHMAYMIYFFFGLFVSCDSLWASKCTDNILCKSTLWVEHRFVQQVWIIYHQVNAFLQIHTEQYNEGPFSQYSISITWNNLTSFKLTSWSDTFLPTVVLQLQTIKVIVNSRVLKRSLSEWRFGVKEVLSIGKQRLATDWDCSTVDYILEEGMVEVWKACGTCM